MQEKELAELGIKEGCSVYLFLGDDLDRLQAAENAMIHKVEDPGMADLNIARLNGQTDALDELVKNIGLFPFGVEKRLVIYTDPLVRIHEKKELERWQKIVENVPPTTILVLLFPTIMVKKNKEWMWKSYADHHWFEQWAARKEDGYCFKEFRIPSQWELPARVIQMAEKEGGTIEKRAAEELARLAAGDTLLIRQEVKKLCTFANGERTISVEDVHLLCSAIPEEDVFAMVDAFALGDAPRALHHLKLMFANQDYARVFPMIVRQFRLLLLVKEALQEGPASAVAEKLHESNFVVQKIIPQSKRFTMEELEHIYHALYDMDGDVKRGNITPEVGLELIFFENTGNTMLQE